MIKNFYLASTLILASAVVSGGVATPSAPQGEQPEFKINTTIEEDVSSFGFSPEEKYSSIVDENLTESPVVLVNFYLNESKNNIYYFYGDINEVKDINLILKYKDIEDSIIPKLYFVDYDENLKISRFVDNNDKPDELKFDDLVNVSIDYLITDDDNMMSSFRNSEYQFNFNNDNARASDDSIERSYNQSIQISLIDPHAWSYRFDTDDESTNIFENLKDLFGLGSDTLQDQFFYSFKMPSGWTEYEIADISMQWKEIYLTAYSYGVLSNIDEYDYFESSTTNGTSKPSQKFDPLANYYIPSETGTEIFPGYYATYISHTKEDLKNSDEYKNLAFKEETINPDKVNSNIGNTYFEWNKIQSKADFDNAFKNDQEIIDFGNYYMPDDNYFVVNFNQFQYSYQKVEYAFVAVNPDKNLTDMTGQYLEFYKYLRQNEAPWNADSSNPNIGLYEVTYFQMLYNMDISAKSMTLVNSNGEKIQASIDVEPVDQENSGGDSDNPISDNLDWWNKIISSVVKFFSSPEGWLITIGVVAGVIVLIVIISAIVKAIQNDESKK